MDIQQTWRHLNEQQFESGASTPLAVGNLSRHSSNDPLAALRRNVKINMAFAAAFFLGFCVLFARFSHPYIRITLGILMLVYLTGVFFTAYRLKRLPTPPNMAAPMLTVMKAYHDQLRHWINWQQKVALFIYPVAAMAGYLLSIATRADLDMMLQKTNVLWTLLISMAVATPIGHWLSRRMSKAAFGQYLDQLKANIELLEKHA